MNTQDFSIRNIGTLAEGSGEMLSSMGEQSIDSLIDKTMPAEIRLKEPLGLPAAMSEHEILEHLRELST